MDELTRDDLVTVLVALQSEIESWRSFLEADKKQEWTLKIIKYDVEQLERFQAVREKVEKILHETLRNS